MSPAPPNAASGGEPGGSAPTIEELALAFQAGESAALITLHARLAVDVTWLVGRLAYRLPEAPSLELADLRQEAWLALAEAARGWDPKRDGDFRRHALRTLSRTLPRSLRRQRSRGAARLGEPPAPGWKVSPDPVDPAPPADPSRWGDAIVVREVAAALPPDEWHALRGRVVGEQSLSDVAADLGVTRHAAERLLHRARLRARAVLGTAPPPTDVEAEVLAAVRDGVDPWTGRGPTGAWVMARTGLGRRRLRAVLDRLAALGYLHRRGQRWETEERR